MPDGQKQGSPSREAAKVQTIVLLLLVFILGVTAGALWIYRSTQAPNAPKGSRDGIRLSESTRAALNDLKSPVELRFYSILDKKSSSDSLLAFAGRVDQVLSEYQREAAGKIQVTRYTSESDSDLAAAAADGIQAFDLDKGEGSFLGISVAQQGQKELLPHVAPEWEQALESDLTRAILRVTRPESASANPALAGQAEFEAIEAVKRSIPNLDSISVEEGRKILREMTLKEFKAAAAKMQGQVQQAQQRLSEAQAGKSEADQQAAMKDLQEAQALQAQQIKEIAARFQAQTAALERLKTKP